MIAAARRLPRAAAGGATDAGSGSALALGIVAAIVALVAVLLPLYSVFADRARIAAAADAGALAAADAVAGFSAVDPCSLAAALAAEAGATMASCVVDGLVVTVVVSDAILGVTLTQTATAGPPPAEPEPARIR